MNLNRSDFKDSRVAEIRKYLNNRNGPDPAKVQSQIDYYKTSKWTLKNGRIFIDFKGDRKELLSDTQIENAAKKIYDTKIDLVGGASAVYHLLKPKYWNVSLPKVARGLKKSKTYSTQDYRQLSKPKNSGYTVDGNRVGALVEADLTFYSPNNRGPIKQRDAGGYVGLAVVVDALSGLTGARPIRSKAQAEVAAKTREILRSMVNAGVKLKGGSFSTDGGNEFQNPKKVGAGLFTAMVHKFGMKAYQAAKRTAKHVEQRNGDIRRALTSRMAALNKKDWVPLVPAIIKAMNKTSFSPKDPRHPMSPNDIVKLSPKLQKKLFFQVRDNKRANSKKLPIEG